MSEVPSNTPPDDFEAFLDEAEQTEAQDRSWRFTLETAQMSVDASLAELGFVPLRQDRERQDTMYRSIVEEKRQIIIDKAIKYGKDPELLYTDAELWRLAHELAENKLVAAIYHDDGLIEDIVRGLVYTTENYLKDSPYSADKTSEQLNYFKHFRYARYLVLDGLSTDHPIVQTFNALMPGDVVEPDSEALIPHLLDAAEALAQRTSQEQATQAIGDEALRILGMDPEEPITFRAIELRRFATDVLIAAALSHSTTEVNREESLRGAVGKGLPRVLEYVAIEESRIEALIRYAIEAFPLHQEFTEK